MMPRALTTCLFATLCALAPFVPSAEAAPLRYAEDRAPSIVHPAYATSMSEARINELVFEGLFSDDYELRSTGRLATGLTLADDKKSAIVQLRSGVSWHDGTPFTAADVVFTIEALKNPATASTEAGRVSWIASAIAVDALTVKLTFASPEWAPQDKLHFKILPKHAFTGTALKRTDAFRNKPIGTGPYVVSTFNDDASITLARNLNYYDKARMDELVMREVADKNYQAKLLIYESLEGLVRVLPRDLAALQNDRKIELYPYQTNSWWYVGFNMKDTRLADPRVRLAVQLLIDIPALLAPIGTGETLSGPFVRSSPFYNHDVPVPKPNVARARQLLEDAGYTLNGRQWEKEGKPLRVRVATQQNLETAQDVLINLQSQLQTQGLIIDPVFLPVAEWKQKIWKDRDFDLILSQWSFDRNEDIYEQFHSKGTRNFVAYANPATDRLLDDARQALDPEQKKQLLRQAHAQIASDNPMVFLWTLDSYSALSVRVKDVVVHPFYFFTWARDWNVE